MNYNLIQAIDLFNNDQVRTQHMYEIDLFSGIPSIDATLTRMQVYGNGFSLPDRTVNFEELQYRAYKIPIPTNMDMGQDHDITLYADVRGDLRRACLDWQAACLDPDITGGSYFESNRRPTRLGPGDGQTPSITVKLLAPDFQTPVETTVIYGTRVTKVGGLELSNTGAGISTFQVSFKSVYWEQLPGGSSIGNLNRDNARHSILGNPGADGDANLATNDPLAAANLM